MLLRLIISFSVFLSLVLASEKSLTLSSSSVTIQVDGFIEENEWLHAAVAKDYYEIIPAENKPAATETQTLVTYDEKNLYIAFKAFDDPEVVRAHQSKRDAISEDDMVGVIIDPQNNGVMAYQFYCNPFGNQGDGQKFGQADNGSWDALWYSSGRMTKDGYEVEMAIPFSTFRISNSDEYHWRITFMRKVPREDSERTNAWTPYDRDDPCDICQLGHIYGIKDIITRAPIEFLPSFVAAYDESIEYSSNLGFGITLPIGNSGTAEITFNPDFSQVESNATKIDINSKTALSYPETRPFFNEGIDLFNTGSFGWKPKIRTVYTRSINQPIIAAKMLGQSGNTQYGYLGARDQNTSLIIPFGEFGGTSENLGESTTNIFRLKHSLDEGSYIGGILSDRRYNRGSGSMGGLDGLYRFNNNVQLDWQIFVSNTIEPNDTTLSTSINGYRFNEDSLTSDLDGESFSGHSAYLSLERSGRNGGSTLMYVERTPTFRADNGYVDLNDQRELNFNMGKIIYPETELFEVLYFWFAAGRVLFYDWSSSQDWLYLSHKGTMKGQFGYDITFLAENEFYQGERFNNNYKLMFEFEKNLSKMLSIEIEPQFGTEIIRVDEPYQARNVGIGGKITLKPSNEFKIHVRLNQSRSTDFDTNEEIYSDLISRIRLEYQATSSLNVRFVTQYHDFEGTLDVQPLISYQPDPFSIYYIGTSRIYVRSIGNWKEDFGQVYLKIQKLFSL